MGLDIYQERCINTYEGLVYTVIDKINKDKKDLINELLISKNYDELLKEIEDEENYTRDDIPEDFYIYELSNVLSYFDFIMYDKGPTESDMELVDSYSYLFEREDLVDPRMGSYSTIHYGREFAYCVSLLADEQDIDPEDISLDREQVGKILSQIARSTITYKANTFDNLCMHSDSDGYYLPSRSRLDFDYGSSVELLKELDILFKSGAVDILSSIIEEIDSKYMNDSIKTILSRELQSIYNCASNAKWVLEKMMFEAIVSVSENMIITFC